MNLLHTVTDHGHFYFINSKRVSRLAYLEAKAGKRLECFITRATRTAVRNYCLARA